MSGQQHQHRFHESGGDSLGKSFEVHIHGHEFNYSDQLKTVIAAIHGEQVSEHAHFHVDGEQIPHHNMLDEWRGAHVKVLYLGPYQGKDHGFVNEFDIPDNAN
jgi:hypothetical protein